MTTSAQSATHVDCCHQLWSHHCCWPDILRCYRRYSGTNRFSGSIEESDGNYTMMLNDYHIYMSWCSIYIHGTLDRIPWNHHGTCL